SPLRSAALAPSALVSSVLPPASCPHRALHSFPTRRSSDLLPPRTGRSCPLIVRARTTAARCCWTGPVRSDPFGPHLPPRTGRSRSEEHTSELQSRFDLVCRLLLEKKKASAARAAWPEREGT